MVFNFARFLSTDTVPEELQCYLNRKIIRFVIRNEIIEMKYSRFHSIRSGKVSLVGKKSTRQRGRI